MLIDTGGLQYGQVMFYLNEYVDRYRWITVRPGEGIRLEELLNVSEQECVFAVHVLVEYAGNNKLLAIAYNKNISFNNTFNNNEHGIWWLLKEISCK